ncbi:MAG: hypothetical protein BJ554DRAFT_7316 [Olpidium bornovanus]|uniref:Methyltransferase type 11 domain-containing protein n=1 Tax=Olpidium bornovanus TaxID=278681 RepID=A0A8H8DMN0_9FUNG|nr:MAG: hypothetical protein BJ554DRAFT_7316 [Olpidium bornovanus]
MLEKARLFPFHALHCLNIEQPLGIPPNSFDAVVCVGVMDFVALPKAFLEQVARILRPEGVFGVTLPERRRRAEAAGGSAQDRQENGATGLSENDELSSFDWTEADDLVASAGFHIHRRERFLGYVDSETGAETHYYGYLLRLG